MKIKVRKMPYEKVLALQSQPHKKPIKPHILFRSLIRVLSAGELHKVNFQYTTKGMDRLAPDEPALYLMNHSCFLDLKIASRILYPRPFNIVCTSDGFVGKNWLMRAIGCIPTRKFMSDPPWCGICSIHCAT